MKHEYEQIVIDGTRYNILDTLDDGRLEIVEYSRMDYATHMYAFKLKCPDCGEEFYVLDDGITKSVKCPGCKNEIQLERPWQKQ